MNTSNNPSLIIVQRDSCGICGACVPVCGSSALVLHDNYLEVNNDRCTACEKCLAVCPTHALLRVDAESVVLLNGGVQQ